MTYHPDEAAHYALGCELMELAESYAGTYYGCDLSALDSSDFEPACYAVTEANLDDLAWGLAENAYRRSQWA